MTHFIVHCHMCGATEHYRLPYDEDHLEVLTKAHKCRASMVILGGDDE